MNHILFILLVGCWLLLLAADSGYMWKIKVGMVGEAKRWYYNWTLTLLRLEFCGAKLVDTGVERC